ncbi:MAG: hypothetical protein QOF83_1043 [Solirubrobacteraceae bacterium]|jgi:hypothetical protein|nr:hypothetical protein [Solirubrobacteraceae bacterium]
MALNVALDERAPRNDGQPPGAGVIEREGGQRRAEALALAGGIDLGVRQDDAILLEAVLEEADGLAIDRDDIAVGGGLIGDVGRGHESDARASERGWLASTPG